MKRPNILVNMVLVFLTITLPFILAAVLGGREQVFIGFLLNPADGASYLAKMHQGWSGSWRFVLPFTAEPGSGAYLFLFYLFLGHLSRWLGMPIMIMFHLARLVGAGLLMLALTRFYDYVFADRPDLHRIAFWLTIFGSGMGWLILAFGTLPTDFWVAEAYPFLSMYSNPHFSTGLALILYALTLLMDRTARMREGKLLLAGLLISVILPFGVVLVLLLSFLCTGWIWLDRRRLEWRPVIWVGLLGGPFLLYQYWAAHVDPVLSIWNQQNQTPSPPIWDFLLAFSPALLLAPFGILRLYRDGGSPAREILIAWLALGILLIYFPFALQRRFMLGFYVPAAALATFGVDFLCQKYGQRTRALVPVIFALALPTNLLIILIGIFGALGHSPLLYLSQDEARALDWIQAETPEKALVLASPELGSLIPGFTGRRVIYGHPFETADAIQEEQRVRDFYSYTTEITPTTPLINDRAVEYVLYGPREKQLGGKLDLSMLRLVFESGDVRVYAVRGSP